jgi:hypothetical protein
MVSLIKLFHPPEIGGRKALDAWKLCADIGSQFLDDGVSPGFALLPLDNQMTDPPVQLDQLFVDRFESLILCRADAPLDFGQKGCVITIDDLGHTILFSHCVGEFLGSLPQTKAGPERAGLERTGPPGRGDWCIIRLRYLRHSIPSRDKGRRSRDALSG